MKAAVYNGIRNLEVQEVDDLRTGPREIRVRVKYCGICGSDLHEYLHGLFPQSPFGHEACGEVVECGAEVKGFRPGDRVLAFQKGSYAQCVLCPPERLLRMPPEMTWKQAAVVEPLAGAAYALDKGGVRAGDTALVAGAGPVGLMILLGLKALGVQSIYVTEISEARRKKALEMGAIEVLNPKEAKVPSWIKEVTGGRGVDVAVESVGVESTLKDCLASVRYQGKVIVQGIFTDRVPVHMLGFVTRETTMIGTNSINPQIALKWIAGGAKPEAIVTK
ncbi:MAG TPA: zinc-binding dehydrogenase, partial [Thermodesulfobacteriota bacterium]|nr:zinc-binding dehydrogenase [Thermodesulfobacteriota bacterium]